jgi:deoxyadenosine/deoxycytidine kinase
MRVIVEGLIGVGKSTFVRCAQETWGLTPMYESVDDNPFLERYYADPRRWAYSVQMYFLYDRFQKHLPDNTILDRSLYGDFGFAAIQLKDGFMDQEEYDSYLNHAGVLSSRIPAPDLCIHLHITPEKALERIAKRGRGYESSIPKSYLESLAQELEVLHTHLPEGTRYERLDWGDMTPSEIQDAVRALSPT